MFITTIQVPEEIALWCKVSGVLPTRDNSITIEIKLKGYGFRNNTLLIGAISGLN